MKVPTTSIWFCYYPIINDFFKFSVTPENSSAGNNHGIKNTLIPHPLE